MGSGTHGVSPLPWQGLPCWLCLGFRQATPLERAYTQVNPVPGAAGHTCGVVRLALFGTVGGLIVVSVLLGVSFWLMLRAYVKHVVNDGVPDAPRWNNQNLLRLALGALVTAGVVGLVNHEYAMAVLSGAFVAVIFAEVRHDWRNNPPPKKVHVQNPHGSSSQGGPWSYTSGHFQSSSEADYKASRRAYGHGPRAGQRYPPRSSAPSYAPGDGPAFEAYIAYVLREQGWHAVVTPKGADSGIDVVARQAGRTVVVQAKNTKQPAGRRAVQEAYAGKGEAQADEAWVVSANGFTPQAKASARKLGVKLLNPRELEALAYAEARRREREERRREQEATQARQRAEAERQAAQARYRSEAERRKREQEATEARNRAQAAGAEKSPGIEELRARALRQAQLDAEAGERIAAAMRQEHS